jgi:branched-chain amino acid aminotransferase
MLELVTDTAVDLARSAARHGVGLFETIRVEGGRPLHLGRHLARLARGAAYLELPEPPPAGGVLEFLATRTRCAGLPLGVVRLLALDRHLIVRVEAWEPDWPEAVETGVAEDLTRLSSSPLCRFKTMSYLENVLLGREARRRGLHEVIARNEAGLLTDGARTTVFLVMRGEVLTPAACHGALPGIVREIALEAGAATERALTVRDLDAADAVLLTNALREVVPVARVAGSGEKDPAPAALPRLREVLERAKRV